jgi:hypothetical protein
MNISISFDNLPDAWIGYPVRVRFLDSDLNPVDNSIFLGSETHVAHDFTPGKYMVTIRMPSGEAMSQPVTLDDHNHIVRFTVPEKHSNHEWLSEQTFLGHAKFVKSFMSPNNDPWNGLFELKIWRQTGWAGASIKLEEFGTVDAQYQDGQHGTFNIDAPLKETLVASINYGGSAEPQMYICVPPTPKISTARQPKTVVDVSILPEESLDIASRLKASINTSSLSAQSLISYLTTGDITSASVVSDSLIHQARQHFYEKNEDVVGAVVAGYFLQMTSNIKFLPADWFENLADRLFPSIADGPILYAYRLMDDCGLQPTEMELDPIAKQLQSASARGLPIFSRGLRLLQDGLVAMRNSYNKMGRTGKAEGLSELLTRTSFYLSRCNPSNPYTTIVPIDPTNAVFQLLEFVRAKR